jgi:competence protein ComEC
MRDPLLIPAVLAMAGILAGKGLDFTLLESTWPLAALAALWAASAGKSAALKAFAAGSTMFFTGVLLQAVHKPSPAPEIEAGSREVVLVEGCVVEPAALSADRARFTLELGPGARARVSLPADDGGPPQRLAYGQRVEIEARVRPPRNYRNPGGFDYEGYLARRDIFWTASMPRGSRAKILAGRCGWRVLGWIFALRAALIDRIERLYAGDSYATGMLEAILAGETSRIERSWTEDFRKTGSYHALVISGVHISVLAGVLLFFFRLVPVSPMAGLAFTAMAAWVYAGVAGFSPPVVRAAAGFSLFLAARFFFRKTRVVNLLAAVVLLFLAWDPDQLFDASFQLSFLSVFTLAALAVPWMDRTANPVRQGMRQIGSLSLDPHLEPRVAQWRVEVRLAAETVSLWLKLPVRHVRWVLARCLGSALWFVELFMVSAVIQAGLALPMIWYFHRASLTGLSSNLLIVPAMNAIVPVGFLAIGTGWHWASETTRVLLMFSAKVAEWHSRWEPVWRLADPPWWLAAALAIAVLASLWNRTGWLWAPATPILLGLLVWQPWPARIAPQKLELTAIDVGQGDSLLLVFPQGATMLVDGGGILSFGQTRRLNFDIGEDVVSPYLWSRGIRNLDVIVATHAHQDHIGGLKALLANFRPRELWTGANPAPDITGEARRLGITVVEQHEGRPFDFSGARIEIMAPPSGYTPPKPGNNDSLVLRLEYGSRSFLLTGDVERDVENQLLAYGHAVHADVLKVAHHGSRTSSIDAFLEAVSPSIALISAGYENSFGHPHPDVLSRLWARHAAILRTDLGGLITVQTDGTNLAFDIEQWHAHETLSKFPILEGLLQ